MKESIPIIEAKALYDKVSTQVIPAGMKVQKKLVETITGTLAAPGAKADLSVHKDFLIGVTMLISNIRSASKKMKESCEKAGSIKDEHKKAEYYGNEIKFEMDAIRKDVEKLAMFIDDDLYTIPKSWGKLFIS